MEACRCCAARQNLKLLNPEAQKAVAAQPGKHQDPENLKVLSVGRGARASVSKEARLEACRCCAARQNLKLLNPEAKKAVAAQPGKHQDPENLKVLSVGRGARASVSKEARLEACRCCAARRSSAPSSGATRQHARVGRSSGGGSPPSSGGRKSRAPCSATSVRSACARAPHASPIQRSWVGGHRREEACPSSCGSRQNRLRAAGACAHNPASGSPPVLRRPEAARALLRDQRAVRLYRVSNIWSQASLWQQLCPCNHLCKTVHLQQRPPSACCATRGNGCLVVGTTTGHRFSHQQQRPVIFLCRCRHRLSCRCMFWPAHGRSGVMLDGACRTNENRGSACCSATSRALQGWQRGKPVPRQT